MSIFGVETALHQLSTDRRAREEFRVDATRFLSRFGLDAPEIDAVRGFDVRTLQANGVSPLLTYGFWLTTSDDRTRGAYLRALGGAEGA